MSATELTIEVSANNKYIVRAYKVGHDAGGMLNTVDEYHVFNDLQEVFVFADEFFPEEN